jgi:precorrin-4 C11-methyltransferase
MLAFSVRYFFANAKRKQVSENAVRDSEKIALIAVTRPGLEMARRLRTRLRAGEVYRPDHYGPSPHPWEYPFPGPLSEQVPSLFTRCDQLVFFLAAGAVARLIAPCLVSKTTDPGVLAIDEMGQFVVPILSGHLGGANAFARIVAGCLGSTPVITTASDLVGGLSPDLLAQEYGWIAEPEERLKAVALALVNQEPVAIVQEIGGRDSWLDEKDLPAGVCCVRNIAKLPRHKFAKIMWITERLVEDLPGLKEEDILWYRPRSLVLGVGCERGISLPALEDGLNQFLKEHRISRLCIRALASAEVKADEEALLELAKRNAWETRFFRSEELAEVPDLPTPSPVVEKCVGTPGVAEPAALLAAGAQRLLVEKQIVTSVHSTRRMTFALARAAEFVPAGVNQGKVTFIGAGPGDPDLVTHKARRVLAEADVVVYAGSLIPEAILRLAPARAVLHNSASLTLEEVTDILIKGARAGQLVARLQSGDTSIYSAIREQMVLLDEAGVAFKVIPGISSYQALAASLACELTVPGMVQTVILTRGEGQTSMPEGESLEALARHGATLAIFLSARLGKDVQARLLTAYPAETPVVIAYRVSWPDEMIVRTTLDKLQEALVRYRFSRTTLILVGAALAAKEPRRSQLYDPEHGHIFRAARREATM